MKAMTLHAVADLEHEANPLHLLDLPEPQPGATEVLIEVQACGVCHTELDEIEGRTPPAFYPIVPGHQVVGYVVDTGNQVKDFNIGDRVGVAWIASACGDCRFCTSGLENLCSGKKRQREKVC